MVEVTSENAELTTVSVHALVNENGQRPSFREPFLIKDMIPAWEAHGAWTPDSLVTRFGDRDVPVWRARKDIGPQSIETIEMPLRQYVEEVESQSDPEHDHYIGSLPITKFLPELASDFEVANIGLKERHLVDVMYFGARLYSQLHYHPYGSAILSMVYGEKTVRLMPPDATTCLYKYGTLSGFYNFSRMESWTPDLDEFPRYKQVHPVEIRVQAGEALFIPAYWWHGIQNGDMNIAVTSFYKSPFLSRWIPPRGLRKDYFYSPVRWMLDRQ